MSSSKALQLTQTARELFIKHGIRRVTVEEICRKAGVSKVTFYKYFSNKIELAAQIVAEVMQDLLTHTRDIMASDKPFRERLLALLTLEVKAIQEFGDTLLYELYEIEEPELQMLMQNCIAEGYDITLEFFAEGQREGAINPQFSKEFFLYLMELGDKMYKDTRLISIEPDNVKRTRMMQDFLMHGLMTPEDPQDVL